MSPLWDMFRVTVFGSDNGASRIDTPAFDPARDIPSLAGKTILITGAAGDLGRQTAIDLIRHGKPELVYVADLPRSEDEKRAVLDGIHHDVYGHEHSRDPAGDKTRVRYLDLDLGSFESVRQCARGFLDENQRLDVLICNAGIIRMTPGTTADGYEAHFGINYLGHALLVRLLAPVLLRTAEREPEAGPAADARIVLVSSEGHVFAPEGGVEFDAVKTDCAKMSYSTRYGQSKVALIGLMKNLSRQYPQIKCVAIHPGRILTGMARSLQKESLLAWLTKPIAPLFCVPVATGIRNHLWAATSPEVVSGRYYEPVGVPGTLSAVANDEAFYKRLQEWTDEALKGVDAPIQISSS
ncbi:hypothetical protein BJX68DRAFT_152574 [Aspergillus pseudodeflectus]|uniref:NAD(P)-binding protein n=1 Tax=Aspergillus pseudodeflectus TaxID=176178 RepID=A0ABR4JVI2_9EURO